MAHLTLGLLGSLQVTVANASITTFESDKARALLAYLAVEADRPQRREALIGLLWPECPESAARQNLRQGLYNLRQVIGDHQAKPPYLLISREEIQFNPASDYALDVANFDAHLAATEVHPHTQLEACKICAARLRQAVDLYRGEFLEQFFLEDSAAFEEWALVRRETLHRRTLEALVHLANHCEQSADYEPARGYALRQLELDPWREEAHRQVMRVLAANGQRSEALAQYENCRRVLAKELGLEPSGETQALYEQIKGGGGRIKDEAIRTLSFVPSAGSGQAPRPSTLPVSLTPFIGREREVAELARLLGDPECRLLTLVGPGGIGKTRLALQAAANQRESWAQGAAFVALASVDSPAFMTSAIGDAVGLVFYGPADPKLQLLNYLREKQMLLVLDNVEHLLDGVGLFVEILEQAPEVKLLVTSREQLNLQGEWVYELGGLQVPASDQGEAFEESSAVALFLQRARRAHAGFNLHANERRSVGRICRLVGGMPLAIELAAAWVRTLSPGEIDREIERSLDFLGSSVRDLPERHRSMRAVFDRSWHLLGEQEQEVLARLSVFRGGMQREAAEAVAGANLPLLSALLAKSLLRRLPSGRYDLHELVRQYAREKLIHSGERERVKTRHLSFFLALAEKAAPQLQGPEQVFWLDQLEQERDNLRAALKWSLTTDSEMALRLASALSLAWVMRSRFTEGRGWLESALAMPEAADISEYKKNRVKTLWGAGRLAGYTADYGAARRWLYESIDLCRRVGCTGSDLAYPLRILGGVLLEEGDLEAAGPLLEESLRVAVKVNDQWAMGAALESLGTAALRQGEYTRAQALLEESLLYTRRSGDKWAVAVEQRLLAMIDFRKGHYLAARPKLEEGLDTLKGVGDQLNHALSLWMLGEIAQYDQDYANAEILYRQSVQTLQELGNDPHLADCLAMACALACLQGQFERAARLFGALEALCAKSRYSLICMEAAELERTMADCQARLAPEIYNAAKAEGKRMTIEQALVYASDTAPLAAIKQA